MTSFHYDNDSNNNSNNLHEIIILLSLITFIKGKVNNLPLHILVIYKL